LFTRAANRANLPVSTRQVNITAWWTPVATLLRNWRGRGRDAFHGRNRRWRMRPSL